MAAAFVGDGDFQDDDPEIGEIKFLIKSWGSTTEDVKFKELNKRKCQEKDFEVVGDSDRSEHGFFATDEGAEAIVKESGYNIQCIVDDYHISGDFNSFSASNLMVVFEVCDSSVRTCKS